MTYLTGKGREESIVELRDGAWSAYVRAYASLTSTQVLRVLRVALEGVESVTTCRSWGDRSMFPARYHLDTVLEPKVYGYLSHSEAGGFWLVWRWR